MLNYKAQSIKKRFHMFHNQIKQVFSHRHAKHKYAILYLSNNRESIDRVSAKSLMFTDYQIFISD